jgi:hypothetical protein
LKWLNIYKSTTSKAQEEPSRGKRDTIEGIQQEGNKPHCQLLHTQQQHQDNTRKGKKKGSCAPKQNQQKKLQKQ